MRARLHFSLAALVVATSVLLSACSDNPTEVTPPSLEPVAPLAMVEPAGCTPAPTAASLLTMLNQLLPRSPLRTSLIALVNSLPKRYQDRIKLAVRRLIYPIQELVFRAYYAGRLTGGTSSGTLDNVLRFSEALHCYVGLTPPNYPTGTAGNDVVVGTVFPNGPRQTFSTPTEHAALTVESNSVTEPITIVVRQLASTGPLRTSLDQYGLFYEFSGTTATGQPAEFTRDFIAGVCLETDVGLPPLAQLRLAHNVTPFGFGDVEVLPPVNVVPGLNCDDLGSESAFRSPSGPASTLGRVLQPLGRIFLPQPLHASAAVALATAGVGGTARKFSPFGVVDIFSNPGLFLPLDPTESEEDPGSTVTRTVRVTSANESPIANVPVTFATEEGNGTVLTDQPVLTDANGEASAEWELPDESGEFTLDVSVPAIDNPPAETTDPPAGNVASIPDVAFDPQTLTFTATTGPAVFFSDGFEEFGGWTTSGFWNISTLMEDEGGPIVNQAFPTYVNLPTGDGSAGALPAPFAGDAALWYGSPATGNYLGTQVAGDQPLSGGISTVSNSGDAVSPEFSIPEGADAAVLRFRGWFEIEGVNPFSFDLMTVHVISDGVTTQVSRLNPTSGSFGTFPNPFTSAQGNAPPVWEPYAVDLSDYIGSDLQLVFRFRTGDANYNGFRGWIVDNVQVTDEPIPAALRLAPPAPPVDRGPEPPRPGRP